MLCTEAFEEGLNPENACQLFARADRFQLADLRRMALEEIWINAEDALKECPSIRPDLLEEILAPGLICISDADLRVFLKSWCGGRKRKAGEEATFPWPSPLQPIVDRHLHRMTDVAARMLAAFAVEEEAELPQELSCYSVDVFNDMYSSPPLPFLGYCLNAFFGSEVR